MKPNAPLHISRLSLVGIALLALLFTGCGLLALPYTCPGGTPRSGDAPDRDNRQYCVACNNPRYTAVNGQCVQTEFTCPNGTPYQNGGIAGASLTRERCSGCNNDFILTDDDRCQSVLTFLADSQLILQETIATESVTAQITASEDAQLWWVLYDGNTTINSANTVITDAQSSGGVQNSGAAGTDIMMNIAHRIAIGNLHPDTSYALYVAINNDNAPEPVLSEKLSFTTTSVEPPAFTSQPTITDLAQISATVLVNAVRATELYWVLYDSEPATALTADTLITDATANGGVQRDTNDITNSSAIINLNQLVSKQSYYFYAVITNQYDNHILSEQLPINTAGYLFVCLNGTRASGTSSTDNHNYCSKCDASYRLDDDDIDDDSNNCVVTKYTCQNGTPVTDSRPSGNADVAQCISCKDYYQINSGHCEPVVYICPNGTLYDADTPQNEMPDVADKHADIEKCKGCRSGYRQVGDTCVATKYICDNGDAETGSPPGNADVQKCLGCDTGNWFDNANSSCIAHGTLDASDSYGVLANGITIVCPQIANDGSFTIGGTEYTKRTETAITTTNAHLTCVTGITDMNELFRDETFNGNISHWDVSAVTTMVAMFRNSSGFTQNINNWDVSSVTDMTNMFRASDFNQPIGNWQTYNVETMAEMFRYNTAFDQAIGNWDVQNVTDMEYTFGSADAFNQDISTWCVTDIDVKPTGFDDNAPLASQATQQPKWGVQLDSCRNRFTCSNGVATKTTPDNEPATDNTVQMCMRCDSGATFISRTASCVLEFDLAGPNGNPTGIWSDGTTMWVADTNDDKLYAYTLADGTQDTAKEFNLANNADPANDNALPTGIWSDDTTMWVVDLVDNKVYAYTLADGTQDTAKEFNLATDNSSPQGIWSNGTTMWVADAAVTKLYAYTLADGTQDTAKEFNLASNNDSPQGIWSDGTTMWVADDRNDKLYAYTLANGNRDTTKEFNLASDNSAPNGIWSDGTITWVVDSGDDKLYVY